MTTLDHAAAQQPAGTLRLVLGDQLNACHSWFNTADADVLLVFMEVRQETDYVLHHAQKLIAIFAAMRALAASLRQAGHRVAYFTIDAADNCHSLTANLDLLRARCGARVIEYQEPDEWRVDAQLAAWCASLPAPVVGRMVSSEHFYTGRLDAARLFEGRAKWLMEHFYRHMRSTHQVLLDDAGKPQGGQWNFDADNRQKWPGLPAAPRDIRPLHDHTALWASIQGAGVASFGEPQADHFRWPRERAEALTQLAAFIDEALPHFGQFQDAMSSRAWRLFHSLLSFALNVKMLSPHEVVTRVEAAWRAGSVPLAAAEGFIRQILGWREYVRGVYWAKMPHYAEHNVFEHRRELPRWFWDGNTRMRCMAHAIGQSLEHAHAHHIHRLMVIGNFALLAGLAPNAVHQWYLGVYIDAFEWVELPNTLGMSQYADNGMLATKPYVSGAAYIDRMSDYCKGCHYDKKDRNGERACPFNALYWDFFARNEARLGSNPRIGMVYPQLRKMAPEARVALAAKADSLRAQLDDL
ncbi:cryptochrome/photolyase family protein [Massilia sp. PWRC2]|uniref:cryptochrome/photolyase family protein n=1 Tax=Massilia sp. PWRC2 TaxID=2804626 RepID=UPI003CFA55B0